MKEVEARVKVEVEREHVGVVRRPDDRLGDELKRGARPRTRVRQHSDTPIGRLPRRPLDALDRGDDDVRLVGEQRDVRAVRPHL